MLNGCPNSFAEVLRQSGSVECYIYCMVIPYLYIYENPYQKLSALAEVSRKFNCCTI
jgi:hypothetical protein